MTKKDIKNRIAQLDSEFLRLDPDNDIRVKEAYNNYKNIREEIIIKNKPRRNLIFSQILDLKKQLKIRKIPVREVPEVLKHWLQVYSLGIEHGEDQFIRWYSKDLKYAIVTSPGYMYMSGMNQIYGTTSHKLVDVTKQNNWRNADRIYEVEGRLTKDKLREMINILPEKSREGVKIR